MKLRINDFVDLFPAFHRLNATDQILRMIYFHAVEEKRETANCAEIESLFGLAGVARPKNLAQMLGYLCGKGAKLLTPTRGEYELRREVRLKIAEEVRAARGEPTPIAIKENGPFEFKDRTFADAKVAALIDELRRCHALQCWNACGLLMRIVIERTVDTVDPAVKAKTGLKGKLNKCRELAILAKSVRESIEHLHGAKIIGDIAAHDSKIVVDEARHQPCLAALSLAAQKCNDRVGFAGVLEEEFVMPDVTSVTESPARPSAARLIFLRAAGFGAGFAVVSVVLVISFFWWNNRPKAWSSTEITAKPGYPGFQRRGEEMHVSLAYALTNNTNVEYVVPSMGSGVLMRKVKETSSMSPIEHATWGTPTIPPRQSVDVTFDISFELSDYGTSAADIDKEPPTPDGIPKAELEFIQRRFKEMKDGLVFLDYSRKNHIDLPPFAGVTK